MSLPMPTLSNMSEKISWETVMVYNILKNLVYTGTLVSRKMKSCGVGSKKRVVNEPINSFEIREYYRVPKKPLLNQIAEALRVSPLALSDGGNGPANDILEQLFWLDEEQPGVIKLVPTERGTARYNANPNLALHYDDNDNWPPRSPVAMWFDDTILDDFLKDWAAVQKKLYAGEITQAEYFEWKVMWPDE